ncbi:hypothetical protein [Glycomyces algeriensis]|uniref:Uncharacterized protein n=1 Tax=Glycomyces algeriensis TaxID=256037 RepID=A0A9W6GE02_9ACTN|nr:hypothetical protein [Glycomyces algeriensis]MDA1368623.1 hypothetical protein [Glycomyces algeriensis]MDR7352422.1 hypothetical protein [Glycomyces algeriensis]GLI45161.1 hypothetical protein GALLR39Z86_50110 [Glycomyces algeriensis]
MTAVLGEDIGGRVTREQAWPAVIGSLRRTEEAGQRSSEALRRAAAQCDFDGLDSIAQNLAWRIERQTRLIELDPTHTGQAWPALAWTAKAWEAAGGDATELIDELAPGRALADLALEAGYELTWHQRTQAIQNAAHPLPWASAPNSIHHSEAVPVELRNYLDHVATAIAARVDQLSDHATTERPAWTQAFGESPSDETTYDRWRSAIALTAAHRDQIRVEADDPNHPFGPYPETGRAGHRSYWAAASAALAIDVPDALNPRTGLADSVDQHLAQAIALDIYKALPASGREAVQETLANRLGPAWMRFAPDTEIAITQSVPAENLLAALAEHRLLSPEMAAALQITTPYLGSQELQPNEVGQESPSAIAAAHPPMSFAIRRETVTSPRL